MTRRLAVLATVLTIAAGCATPEPGPSAGQRLTFVTHAEFFSNESHLPVVIDPQVFAVQPGAPQATGAQGIARVEGFRNARPFDASATRLFSAAGMPLAITNGAWFGASGRVTLTAQADGTELIAVTVRGLKAQGVYSLFENHFDETPVCFTPLDGIGRTNSFTADDEGGASITVVAPHALTHDNAVLLVYHSDGRAHGVERGMLGVDAHHQLIVRVP